jgi:hypothetical protein
MKKLDDKTQKTPKLVLSKETLKPLTVRTGIKTGILPVGSLRGASCNIACTVFNIC